MLEILHAPAYYKNGTFVPAGQAELPAPEEAKKGTITYGILASHNTSGTMSDLKIKFDAMASHDITYVGIIQTARASGLKEFPTLRADQLPQQPVRGGRHHQRGRSRIWPVRREKSTAANSFPPTRRSSTPYMRERYAGGGKCCWARTATPVRRLRHHCHG